jgi:endonuclease/exonuclease/phosphatase family metal-dependent hydrolase
MSGRGLERAGAGSLADLLEWAGAGSLADLLEWAVACGLAGWAAARLAGADRVRCAEAWTAPALSFTPQVAAAAWASAVLMRGTRASATAALAGAALTVAVVPRGLPRSQPAAAGPVLRVLTANLLAGRAAADAVVGLARGSGADVLFVQELTGSARTRLDRAGIGTLFAHQSARAAADGPCGGRIYARYPLSRSRLASAGAVQCAAQLELPCGRRVQVICVHARPPKPPWFPRAAARWRAELAALPPPEGAAMILAGDFNATLDHIQFRRLLRRGYVDAASQVGAGLAPTWGPEPSGRPALLTIDHVLTDPSCAVLATSTHPLPGSDHQALYAEIRLPG